MNQAALTSAGKFRIVIAGIFKRQAQLVAREYPNLDIRIANKEANEGAMQAQLFESADRIIAMTKFISHAQYFRYEKNKTILINGGLSKLRAALSSLNAFAKFATAAPVLTPAETETIQFDDEEFHDMAMPHMDFSVFKDAKPGDVLEFIRPPRMAAHKFELSIGQACSYYKRKRGINSESEIKGGKAAILILRTAPPTPILDKAEATLIEAPAITADTQAPARQFWREVYMESLGQCPFADPAVHAANANDAVNGWLLFFSGSAR